MKSTARRDNVMLMSCEMTVLLNKILKSMIKLCKNDCLAISENNISMMHLNVNVYSDTQTLF